jgi:hypothetical protein
VSEKRSVRLDPFETGDWLAAVIQAATGVVYAQQYGGTACRQGRVQGYLVPLVGTLDALAELRAVFEGDLGGTGCQGASVRPRSLVSVRAEIRVSTPAVRRARISPASQSPGWGRGVMLICPPVAVGVPQRGPYRRWASFRQCWGI